MKASKVLITCLCLVFVTACSSDTIELDDENLRWIQLENHSCLLHWIDRNRNEFKVYCEVVPSSPEVTEEQVIEEIDKGDYPAWPPPSIWPTDGTKNPDVVKIYPDEDRDKKKD